jgi:tyrosyl-tRNA synthetase
MNLFDEFKWRGMVANVTPALLPALATKKLTAYIGFDPTAASLHIGSLLPIMCLARLQRFGHTPIAIAGGGTGLIGDPSGKTQERQLLTPAEVEANLVGIKEQLSRFLDFNVATNPAKIINNAEWLVPMSFIEFVRDVGKHFPMNYLLAKESVRKRLNKTSEEKAPSQNNEKETGTEGDEEQETSPENADEKESSLESYEEKATGETEGSMSFTEFTYGLLQAYDYLVLYDKYGCNLQMGGSDQWGNILSGIALIRKLRSVRVHGLVFPLVTSSSGVKFGKTEAGAVWLDAKLTSPYHFYQFWINTEDKDVVPYLKFFTWLPENEIAELEESVRLEPHTRKAQKELARRVTEIVHGETALAKAVHASEVLFGGEIEGMSAAEVLEIFAEVPSTELNKERLANERLPLSDLLAETGTASSKSDARRLIQSGAIYLNNRRNADPRAAISISDLIDGQILIIRKGSRQYHVVKVLGG